LWLSLVCIPMISPMNISFNVHYSLMSEIHLPIPMVDLGYLPKNLSFSWLVRFTILNLTKFVPNQVWPTISPFTSHLTPLKHVKPIFSPEQVHDFSIQIPPGPTFFRVKSTNSHGVTISPRHTNVTPSNWEPFRAAQAVMASEFDLETGTSSGVPWKGFPMIGKG